ncbi:histone-lysine N-methyltransferase SETMAR [Trichonephila clavipes]|nr:histone-lysine N-methyltransferase SETMAR [Trichonephila clavipes]
MVTVYGEKYVSDKSVRKWSVHFRAGRESVRDDQRPGQANTVITSDLIDKVDDLVAISEDVCRLGSEAAQRPGNGTAYGTWYQKDPTFMKWIVTVLETWCHHYEPEIKRDSMQWKHASSPPPKKFRAVKSAGKSHTNETGQVQMGGVGSFALQSGHVALRFLCVWSTEETPEMEALKLGRRPQGHCEGLGLVTATGILGTRNTAACSSVGWL